MAELKTKPTQVSVEDFLNSIEDEQQRKDSFVILKMMKEITKEKPKMWGTSIIGFKDVHLKYASGRELDWFHIGFSPRKAAISLYATGAVAKQASLLKQLGKYKNGKGCLYIKKLADVDLKVLYKIIETGYKAGPFYK